MKFYDREKEISELESTKKISESHKAMIVITGRRRVGKTEIIHQFFLKSKGIYLFVNPKKTSTELLSEFSSVISAELSLPEYVKPETWPMLFKVLFDASKDKPIILAIDEFQRLLDIDSSAIFDLQKIWDSEKGRMFLILSGSSIGMMRKIFIEEKAPLFKRAHNILSITPFDFETVRRILCDYGISDTEEQIKMYSIYGGIPMYYALISDYKLKNTSSTIDHLLLRDFASLKDEIPDILTEEFGRDVPSYYAIMTAISMGKNTAKEICDYAGIKETSISPYIENLSKILDIVGKEVPITEEKPEKSKKGRYILKDNFFRFWFRYIYRNMSTYEIKNYPAIKEKINSDFNSFLGPSFEEICKQTLTKLNKAKKLPFSFEKAGRQWGRFMGEEGKNVYEIDIVALNNKTREILFCECKWKDDVDANKILSLLKDKAKHVEWNNGKRKEYYAIFAKSFKEKIKEPDLFLFDLKDIEHESSAY